MLTNDSLKYVKYSIYLLASYFFSIFSIHVDKRVNLAISSIKDALRACPLFSFPMQQ